MKTTTLTVVTNSITFRVLTNEENLISVTEAFRKTKKDKLGGALTLYCEDLQQNVLVGTEDVKYMSWEPRED